MTEADRAAQMILRTLALVGLGFWALTTAVYGIGDVVNGMLNVHNFRAFTNGSGPTATYNNSFFGLALLSGLAWLFGTMAGAVGVLLGAIQIALAKRGVWLCVGFTVLGVGGIVGAFVTDQLRVNSESIQIDYVSWGVLGALLLPLIALVVFIGSWVSVKAP